MKKTPKYDFLKQLKAEKAVFLAPMAGITDKAFREIVRGLGGKYVVTEMISDKALLYHNAKTFSMLDMTGEDSPRIVQLFGSDPAEMAEAALRIEASGADVIDLNMGCPAPKIVKNGEGAALLKDLDKAEKIAAAVVKEVSVPVTAKFRLGWEGERQVAAELAVRLEQTGVSLVTVHGRTREQYYSGRADWTAIREVKKRVRIPVIGNGDITSPEEALAMLEAVGCDGVMVGRGALGRPWLIGQISAFLRDGIRCAEPSWAEKGRIAGAHLEKLLSYKGEHIGVREMRKHMAWYWKGMRNAAGFREIVMKTETAADLRRLIEKAFLDNNE